MRIVIGEITSAKMSKTLVVRVDIDKKHKKYNKSFRCSKKYYVHTEDESKYNVGEMITIQEIAPKSKLKKWMVLDNTNNNNTDSL
jgi:small subunit ribosomal protein S17